MFASHPSSVQFIRFYPPSVFLQSTICFKYLKIISYRLRISQQINPFNSVAWLWWVVTFFNSILKSKQHIYPTLLALLAVTQLSLCAFIAIHLHFYSRFICCYGLLILSAVAFLSNHEEMHLLALRELCILYRIMDTKQHWVKMRLRLL